MKLAKLRCLLFLFHGTHRLNLLALLLGGHSCRDAEGDPYRLTLDHLAEPHAHSSSHSWMTCLLGWIEIICSGSSPEFLNLWGMFVSMSGFVAYSCLEHRENPRQSGSTR